MVKRLSEPFAVHAPEILRPGGTRSDADGAAEIAHESRRTFAAWLVSGSDGGFDAEIIWASRARRLNRERAISLSDAVANPAKRLPFW